MSDERDAPAPEQNRLRLVLLDAGNPLIVAKNLLALRGLLQAGSGTDQAFSPSHAKGLKLVRRSNVSTASARLSQRTTRYVTGVATTSTATLIRYDYRTIRSSIAGGCAPAKAMRIMSAVSTAWPVMVEPTVRVQSQRPPVSSFSLASV